jgi:hypothetical protein
MLLVFPADFKSIGNTTEFGSRVVDQVVETGTTINRDDVQQVIVSPGSILVEIIFKSTVQVTTLIATSYTVEYSGMQLGSIQVETCDMCTTAEIRYVMHNINTCGNNTLETPGAEVAYNATDSAWSLFETTWVASTDSYAFYTNETSGNIYQTVNIPYLAVSVTMSGYINNSIANTGITGYGYLYGSFPGISSWIQNFQMTAVGGTSTWMYATKTVSIPAGATTLQASLKRSNLNGINESGNIALFDNISVVFECNGTNSEISCNGTDGCTHWGCAPSDYSSCTTCASLLTTQSACEAHGDVTGDTICAWAGGVCTGCTSLVLIFLSSRSFALFRSCCLPISLSPNLVVSLSLFHSQACDIYLHASLHRALIFAYFVIHVHNGITDFVAVWISREL